MRTVCFWGFTLLNLHKPLIKTIYTLTGTSALADSLHLLWGNSRSLLFSFPSCRRYIFRRSSILLFFLMLVGILLNIEAVHGLPDFVAPATSAGASGHRGRRRCAPIARGYRRPWNILKKDKIGHKTSNQSIKFFLVKLSQT